MRVVTLPDGAQSVTVLPAGGGSPVFLGTTDLPPGTAPVFVTLGGDITGAETSVGSGATAIVQGNTFDTTGLGVNAAQVTATGTVQLTAAGIGSVRLDILVDGVPVAPVPFGNVIEVATGSTVSYAIQGSIAWSDGPHQVQVRVTTAVGTTAKVNPGAVFNSTMALVFLAF